MLQVEVIDSLVLHGPVKGKLDLTMQAYRAMERAVDEGKVRFLGLSNTYEPQFFAAVYDQARHKPVVLQNRFYRDAGYDRDLRDICRQAGIRYQSFWTLTANPEILQDRAVRSMAEKKGVTTAMILYTNISNGLVLLRVGQ